jgi:hypothetical protein
MLEERGDMSTTMDFETPEVTPRAGGTAHAHDGKEIVDADGSSDYGADESLLDPALRTEQVPCSPFIDPALLDLALIEPALPDHASALPFDQWLVNAVEQLVREMFLETFNEQFFVETMREHILPKIRQKVYLKILGIPQEFGHNPAIVRWMY